MYATGIHLTNNSEQNKFKFTLVMGLVIRSATLVCRNVCEVDYSSCVFFSDEMVFDVNVLQKIQRSLFVSMNIDRVLVHYSKILGYHFQKQCLLGCCGQSHVLCFTTRQSDCVLFLTFSRDAAPFSFKAK